MWIYFSGIPRSHHHRILVEPQEEIRRLCLQRKFSHNLDQEYSIHCNNGRSNLIQMNCSYLFLLKVSEKVAIRLILAINATRISSAISGHNYLQDINNKIARYYLLICSDVCMKWPTRHIAYNHVLYYSLMCKLTHDSYCIKFKQIHVINYK